MDYGAVCNDVIPKISTGFRMIVYGGRKWLPTAWWSFKTKPTVSEIFNDECDAMVDMTLNDLQTKVKVIHSGANRFFHIRLPIGL